MSDRTPLFRCKTCDTPLKVYTYDHKVDEYVSLINEEGFANDPRLNNRKEFADRAVLCPNNHDHFTGYTNDAGEIIKLPDHPTVCKRKKYTGTNRMCHIVFAEGKSRTVFIVKNYHPHTNKPYWRLLVRGDDWFTHLPIKPKTSTMLPTFKEAKDTAEMLCAYGHSQEVTKIRRPMWWGWYY